MRKAKLTFILALCLGGVSTLGFAGVGNVSRTQSSQDIHDSSVFPAKSSATTSTNGINPFDDGGIVYGIWLTTPPNANNPYVTVIDSEGWNATLNEADVRVRVFFGTSSVTNAILTPVYHKIDPPLRILRGLSAAASACQPNSNTWCYTVVYDSNP